MIGPDGGMMRAAAIFQRLQRTRPWAVVAHVVGGTYADGFMLAGNLAYLSLLTLFPFFIVVATLAGVLGRTADGIHAIHVFLQTVPPDVAKLIAGPINEVIAAHSQKGLLTFGIVVTLWTVSGFIETIREIIRRAYGTVPSRTVWEYRLSAFALIIAAVVLMLAAFAAQVLLTAVNQFVVRLLPVDTHVGNVLGLSRIAPGIALFAALWGIFVALTPGKVREGTGPIWPGPLLITALWIGTTMVLPTILAQFGTYSLTYGSLAGVIVALLFFYIIGLGVVVGAQLNAALANVPKVGQNAGTVGQGS